MVASHALPGITAARSLSDIDRSTAANDPRASASCSARKNPQCIRANTPPVFQARGFASERIFLRVVTKVLSDRLLKDRNRIVKPFAMEGLS